MTYAYTYHYAFRPEVWIIKTHGVYKMKVEGVSGSIFVKRLSAEMTLFDKAGDALAYLDLADEMTVYLWSGKPVAYLSGKSVYGFNGRHLGWFEGGTIYDHKGKIVAVTVTARNVESLPSSPRAIKGMKPMRGIERLAPLEPLYGITWADIPTDVFLLQGAK